MAEHTQNPGANIPGSPACGHWETLLADALDGVLAPQDEAVFTAHKAGCTACAALYEEARQGREWLNFLSAEPEVPAGLVERILAHTGPGHKMAQPVLAGAGAMAAPAVPAWQRPGFMGWVRRWAEPRLMMTVSMAFFSVALTLSLSGVRLSQVRLSSLRPTAVRSFMERQLAMASVPIIRYYDHLRLVYEVQSQMRQLRGRNDEEPQQGSPRNQVQPAGQGESKHKDGGSRVETPEAPGEPARANAVYYGDYVDTAYEAGNEGTREQGNARATDQGNKGQRAKGTEGVTFQIRAFRRLQNPAVRRATERSRVWTA